MQYSVMLSAERDGPVLRLTLNRPEVKNAFDEALIEALAGAFETLEPAVRVVVLAGAGDAFCAGGDLNWMRRAADQTKAENERDAHRLGGLFASIANSHALVIARVHGACFGGGCGLVAAADVALAADDAKFAFSEVRLGLVPATISVVVLPKIGAGNARALFATGETFDAARAERVGLVHEIHPPEALSEAVDRKVRLALQAAPEAVAVAKRLAQTPVLSVDEASALLAEVRSGTEARAGIAAFLSKSPAPWRVAEDGGRA